ncbi:MAG: hypothetical protein K2X90_01145 [Candidatus Babeliaceae bacterium]|nr:hypothetical protein [Candidatus Babeliaceae bacterium]
MTLIKQSLLFAALTAAVFAPSAIHCGDNSYAIPISTVLLYAGVGAIFGYMASVYFTQQNACLHEVKNPVKQPVTANELFRKIDNVFKQDGDDFYQDYITDILRTDGYRVYLPEDQQKCLEVFDLLRAFIDQIPQQEAPNALYYHVDVLAKELQDEFLKNEQHINRDLIEATGASAARSDYYVAKLNALVIEASKQQ